jgi:hypothetical protein
MGTILELSQVPNQPKSLNNFKDFDSTEQAEFLIKFNTVMDQLKDVTLLGDKGLDLEYAIYNGYFIKKSGIIDLKLDVTQVNQLMNALMGKQSTSADAKGTLDMIINFSTDISEIDKPLEIQIPEINESNSFDYMDLMNLITNQAKIN